MDNKKLKKIIIILLVILVVLLLAFGGLYLYRKFVVLKGIERTNVPIQHGSVDTNKKEDKVVLDEEDVKKWLNSNNGIIDFYFALKENDFDYELSTEKDYSAFLFWTLLMNGSKAEIKNMEESSKYSWQYTYTLDYIKDILNMYFGVGINKINVDIMNNYLQEYANFSIKDDKFIAMFNSFGGDSTIRTKLNNIYIKDNQIIVNYDINECNGINDEVCDTRIYGREIVLKKTDNGYNILRSYKVES